jgi:hypothetical protein
MMYKPDLKVEPHPAIFHKKLPFPKSLMKAYPSVMQKLNFC